MSDYYSSTAQQERDTRTADRAARVTSAISIIRVSDDRSDELLQRGSCTTAAERNGLTLVREIPLHAVSGFKGDKRHLAAMADALSAVRSGEVSAVIVAHSSRAARLPHRDVVRWQWDIEEAGGRIISHDEESWAKGQTPMDDAWSLMTAGENHKKSLDISMHVNRANKVRDAAGYFRGAVPSGYTPTGETGRKHLKPHASAPFVIAAFTDSAMGRSTPKIARTFKGECERHGWYTDRVHKEGSRKGQPYRDYDLPVTADGVAKMLRTGIYSTGCHVINRHDGTTYTYRCQPLVSPAQQADAIAALASRTTGDNVTSRAIAKDDFSGALYCAACDGHGRMYRYTGGGKPRQDGTPTPRVRRYRCESCGKSVNADSADSVVSAVMLASTRPWYVPFTADPNASRDRRIAEIDSELAALPVARTPGERRERRNAEDALYAERDSLAEIPDQPVTTYAARKTDDSGRELTEGDRWALMTRAERRDELTSGTVYVYVRASAGRTGAVVVEVEREEDHDGE